MAQLSFEDFEKVDIRTGTIRSARLNPKARKPAYVMEIDFGSAGTKTSSAQLTENYSGDDLVGKQIAAVMNFAPKRIAGVRSEVLVLGVMDDAAGVVLLQPDKAVANGEPIG